MEQLLSLQDSHNLSRGFIEDVFFTIHDPNDFVLADK
jgi:hypothetical protein